MKTDNKNHLKVNFASCKAVASANVKLDGLTVVCGPNATGKSTIAKTTKTMIECLLYYYDCRRSELLSEYSQAVLESLRMFFAQSSINSPSDYISFDSDWRYPHRPIAEREAMDFLDGVRDNVHSAAKRVRFNRLSENGGARFAKQLEGVLGGSIRTADQLCELFDASVEKLKGQLRSVNTESVTSRKFMNLPFDRLSLWNGNVDLTEDNEHVFSYEDSKITAFAPLASVSNVIYLESPLVSQPTFEEDRVSIAGNVVGYCSEEEFSPDETNEFFKALDLVISGQIVGLKKRRNRVSWEYARNDGERFAYQDCATGIKAFAILSQLYGRKCLTDRSVLIIDEPEAHLHPAWIVEYAALLVRIVEKLGVRVLVASHSPDMVNALQSFALCRNLADRTAFYQAEKVSRVDPYRFRFKSLNANVDKIFDSFNSAYALIEKKAKELRFG